MGTVRRKQAVKTTPGFPPPLGQVNARGHLEIGGCDTVELADRFGTPLLVLDEALLRANCRAYSGALKKLNPPGRAAYAAKAFVCTAISKLVESEGLWLDLVSGGELYTAQRASFPPDRILFHGNNKTEAEVIQGLDYRVGRFVVDNRHELDLLDRLTRRRRQHQDIHLRITPGIHTDTHKYVQTGQWDSKFGFPAEDPALPGLFRSVREHPYLRLTGLHCHIGSQIFATAPFVEAAHLMMRHLATLAHSESATSLELNLGGGLAIAYTKDQTTPSIEKHVADLSEAVMEASALHGLPAPTLFLEPGRSIIGRAGVTLYRVGSIKAILEGRTYVAVDGGMNDNPRVALYDAKYEAILANRAAESATTRVTIAGHCCESGDIVIWDHPLPPVASGDLVAYFSTGAYHYAMASNYNRFPRPAVALAHDGKTELIIRRESYEDLVKLDLLPPRLAGTARRKSS